MRLVKKILLGLFGGPVAIPPGEEFPRTADGTGGTCDSDEFTCDRATA